MTTDAFDNLTEIYEALIDWPKRLANESPLYRWLIDSTKARRVLDVACGTGHHAALLNSWGLTVEAADISPAMLNRCRTLAPQSATLTWTLRGYDQPHPHPASFDLAICVGNSLALAPSLDMIRTAIHHMLAAVRPGGAILIHVVNVSSLPDGPPKWQKCLRTTFPQGDTLIHKGIHRAGTRGHVDLLVTNLSTNPPTLRTESVPFHALDPQTLSSCAQSAGATRLDFFGDYQRNPYHPQSSPDLIMVAWK